MFAERLVVAVGKQVGFFDKRQEHAMFRVVALVRQS